LVRRASAASDTSGTHKSRITAGVHNNDIVTRVPPVFMGYRHCGDEIYFDRYGRIRKQKGHLAEPRPLARAAKGLPEMANRPAHGPQHWPVRAALDGGGK
jgi:hypothetical protein